jgi:predicted acyltransferase
VCAQRGISIATTTTAASAPQSVSSRIVSLDVFRGATIAAMILVNDPGTWSAVYWPLDHAEWNGWTPTDLIFPFFLFIVGVAMTLSFAARLRCGATRASLARHVVFRGIAIFSVGLFINLLPHFHFATVRIPGVLQRIGVCYLIAGLIVVATARRADNTRFEANLPVVFGTLVALLVGYWALMRFVPVPGYGVGRLDMEGNLAAWLDRRYLSGHMWGQLNQVRDPEGILSTLPAVGTALWGVMAGAWLKRIRAGQSKLSWFFFAGVIALIGGRLLHPFFPINKNLWTSTFVIFTSGCAMVGLAVCFWIVDVKGWRGWTWPFLVFGSNAIAVYVLADLLAIASIEIHMYSHGRITSIHGYVYAHFFAPLATPYNASLLFGLFFVLLCFLPMIPLYRRRIFIKL